jgi:hypothetical protein
MKVGHRGKVSKGSFEFPSAWQVTFFYFQTKFITFSFMRRIQSYYSKFDQIEMQEAKKLPIQRESL